jgi:hypothetical protein
MITEQQLENFKGMKTYGELDQIKGELVAIGWKLSGINVDTSDVMDDVLRAVNGVRKLMEDM